MTSSDRRKLIAQAKDLPARRIIGKAGLTDGVLAQLRGLFDHAPLIKVRLPKDDAQALQVITETIAQSIPCVLIERRGFTAVFHRTNPGGNEGSGTADSEVDV
jgi:RNA-binding protein YhbY